jgi:hypothetical protein
MYSSSVRPLSELRFFRAATISAGGVGSDGGARGMRETGDAGAVKS